MHTLLNKTLPINEACSILFVFSLSRRGAFFSFFPKKQRLLFFATNFPLFLSKMGDTNNVKEFTNEERSLLKFQKKQQHGQVLLLLLVYSYS